MSDSQPAAPNAIAIIGMSGRFPAAPDLDALWRNLCDGRESISRFSELELLASGLALEQIRNPNYVPAAAVLSGVDEFDAEFFRLSAREAQCTDPQHRVLLECAWEALEGAGYVGEGFGGRVGVFVGAGSSNYWVKNLAPNSEIVGSVAGIQLLIGNAKDYLATRISYKLNLTGPSVTVSTACSTSLVAVHLACQSLLDFHCDIALAGGVSIQVPACQGYLYQEGGIGSPDGHCRPFDAKAQGTVTGSGAGIVALRRLEDAIKAGDIIHAVILGSAVNNDGADKAGFTAPSEIGQSLVIAEALSVAGISPESVSYIEAHGTGTSLGDPIEVAALTRVFRRSTDRRQFCALGSIKSNLGHLDEAAGIAGLIKAVLALRNRLLPPSLHFEKPNPKLHLEESPFFVNSTTRDWVSAGPRRAGVSSFGIGGTNAHVVLEEEAPPLPSVASPRPAVLLVLSAQTRTALDLQCRNLADHLERNPELNLADVAFTLAVGRRSHKERRAVVCLRHEDAIAQLRSEYSASESRRGRPVLLFPGQGSQYTSMGAELYRGEIAFREAIDACATILRTRCDFDLLGALFRGDGGSLDKTINAQPALFSINYAVGLMLRSWGVDAEAMIGHSLGEYVAATLAGVFTLEDALTVVAARGRLMQSTPRGFMISVPVPGEELTSFLNGTLAVAVWNGPASTVLSGSPDAIVDAEARLAALGVPSIRLRTSHGFHSPLMDPILDEFREIVRKTKLRAPKVRFISNVTGDWITASQATDPDYWVKHLREPVRFADGVRRLLKIPECVWIEAGPGRALATLVERHPDRPANLRVLPALPPAKSKTQDLVTILSTLGELWTSGVAVDWKRFYGVERRRRVLLPTYPFERRRYWIDPPACASQPRAEIARAESKISASPTDSWFYAPRWIQIAKPENKPSASKAWFLFADELGLARAAATHLKDSGAQTVIVHNGEAYSRISQDEFILPMDDPAAHARLWSGLDEPLSDTNVLYFASLTPTRSGNAPQVAIPRADRCGLFGLLALLQGLGSSSNVRKLLVITNNTQAVTGNEVPCAERATLWGATRVVAKEYPNLQCSMLDLDWHELDCGSLVDAAVNVLALADRPSASLALRHGSLWEQRIESVKFRDSGTSRIRERGTYLITGGLGSMGMAFAEYLAQTARARLILVSRTRAARVSASAVEGEDSRTLVRTPRFPVLSQVSVVEEIERAAHKAVEVYPISRELESLLNSYCASLVWQFLSSALDSLERGSGFPVERLRTRLGILDKFHKLFERLLTLLRDDGVVRRDGNQIEVLDPNLSRPDDLLTEIANRFPRFVPLADLISHCVRSYPDALSGKTSAIRVLYPDGTSRWLDELMARVPNYALDITYLRTAADIVARLVAAHQGTVRILEVGGGASNLTTHLVETIASGRVEYDFTDIGRAFIARARELAEERGLRNMRFARFDISRPPEPQGFRANSYDLVLGYNVVHATPDLVQTTRHLRSLLAEGGGLILVETVNPPRWIDLIWGLADGWSFADRRQVSPLVSLDEWEKICIEAGFACTTCYPRDPDKRRRVDAGVIIAEVPAPDRASANISFAASQQDIEQDADLRRRISRMQDLGADVCVLPADISDSEDVTRIVRTAEARFGAIHGVIHAAGVLGQTLICKERPDDVRRVLAPKVDGTLNLERALQNQTLDFFVLCSSLSSIDPIPGQFAYSSANAFLDSFAQFRAAKSPNLTVSIDWGFWQELGMIELARVPEKVKQTARDEILTEGWSKRGVEVFARILRGDVPAQLIVSPKTISVAPEASFVSELLSHPVLRECHREDGQRSVFSGRITAGSAWFVDEHLIAGKSVLPGTAYLDMAVAAFWHAHGRGPAELTDVCYLVPMVFEDRETRHVRLILEDSSTGRNFCIVSQLSADRWQEHARGRIRNIPLTEHRRTIDVEAIETRLAAESSVSSHCPPGFWERVGSFPPHWHNVAQAVFGAEEGLARIELTPDVANDLHQFALQPALLDTATGFLSFCTECDLLVPFSFRRICVFASLPERSTSLFRFVSGEAPVFSGVIVDGVGREIVRVEDYALRRAAPLRPSRDTPGEVSSTPNQNVQLEIRSPGRLETLAYRRAARRSPRVGEVEIEVRAAGLNFIEVLYALGMLPNLLDQNVALGQECAGVVTRVGDDVTTFKPGDEVIAYGAECFSFYTTLGATAVTLKPSALSFEQAAGLPAAYLTAWYSLVHLGRLRPGERVLIHAAAGGVGLAAVRIAQSRGAEIFATAGSPEKRQFLCDLGIAHVMDSRTIAFAEDIRRITKGEGVDIVLNSLGGDFIAKSLELLRRRGRFLELGKRDIFRNTELGLGAFANYVAFFAVDIGPDIPGFTEIWVEITGRLRSGELGPLPIRAFAATQALEAFEHMARARHIGKIVLSFADTKAIRSVASPQPDGLPWEDLVCATQGMAFQNGQQLATLPATAHSATMEPEQNSRPPLTTVFRAADSSVEKKIAAVWEKLLGVAPIGADDDFFELKGDSLLVTQVMSRLCQLFDVKLPISLLFDYPTVRQLAAQVETRLQPSRPSLKAANSPSYEEGVI